MEAEEIVAALRTVPAYQRIPVLLFSAVAEAEGQRQSVQCGATAFIPKPGDLAGFVGAVSSMVQRWGGGKRWGRGVGRAVEGDREDEGQEHTAG